MESCKTFMDARMAAAIVTAAGLATLLWYRQRRRVWRPVGVLEAIYIYPLKSGRYMEVEEAECTGIGLVAENEGGRPYRDRVFVIYDEEKMEKLTGRVCQKIFVIETKMKQNSVVFSHPDMPDIEVPLPTGKFDEKEIAMFNEEKVKFVDCGDEVARWVSRLAGGSESGFRMGYWPEDETWRRKITRTFPVEAQVFKHYSDNFSGTFSDLASYHLVNKSSVEDLNSRIQEGPKTIPLNFRPNFLVSGLEPFAEDRWDMVKIGDVVMKNFRPCTRCIMTTINFQTLTKHPKTEPLTTLRSYRSMKQLGLGGNKVEQSVGVMGIYLGTESTGKVRKGDTIYVC